MDPYESEKAARVWQRVYPDWRSREPGENLNTLALQLRQLASTYQVLSRHVTPPFSTILKSMSDKKHAQAACLRGLCILDSGSCPTLRLSQSKPEPIIAALRRCYALEMQLLTHFELCAADPSHGPTFAALAAEQRSCCKTIPELVGQLER